MDRALTILRGCPTGANEAALANLGISREILDALVAAGKAISRPQRYSCGVIATRFWAIDET